MLNSAIAGSIAESRVAIAFLEYGIRVLVPSGNRSIYDLVIDDAGTLLKMQVKTGKWNNAKTTITAHAATTKGPYAREDVDLFAVYEKQWHHIYIANYEEAYAHNHSTIRFHANESPRITDHIFGNAITRYTKSAKRMSGGYKD